jgi:hypothetical protein
MFSISKIEYARFLQEKKIDTIHYNNFEFKLNMYKLIPSRIDIVVQGTRITSLFYKQSEEINKIKMNNSVIPNIFHGEDANRARDIVLNFDTECFCIHDAFGVSYVQINQLI